MLSSTSGSRCGLVVTIAGLIIFAIPGSAAAQGTASIIGQVTDQSGAVLPGVTVTATSPALQAGDVTVGANFDHQSGDAFARQVLLEGGLTIPDIEVNAERIGTRRIPTLNLLTLRVEKSFRFRTAQRVVVRLDVYNALNVNTPTRLVPRSGPRFLRPNEIVPPRVAEFGLAYNF